MSTDNKDLTPDQLYQEALKKGFTDIRENCIRMLQQDQAMIKRIPEARFVENLLPVVRDWVTGKPNDNIRLWIAAAGHPEREIYVTDDSDESQILFVCPPAFASLPMNELGKLDNGRDLTGQDLLDHQSVAIQNSDNRVVWNLERQFIELFSPRGATEAKNKHLLNLVIIWTRYNLPLAEVLGEHADEIIALITKDEVNVSTETTSQVKDDDDDEPLIV